MQGTLQDPYHLSSGFNRVYPTPTTITKLNQFLENKTHACRERRTWVILHMNALNLHLIFYRRQHESGTG